ncbi:LysR family transcriptional regulator [Marinomonas sp. 2405UD66-6]|uniref:LysR family transcriptional regulator n=1 Tax=Marinomonas sp. 2405UD66-6 TaxID=3391834 RepID=UPI0039C8D8A7
MNIRFVEAFVWVARLKSFRAAAQKLNVSQATISGRISSIEAEFDCRLFDRAKHDVVLTNKGYLLLEKAERLLDAEQDLLESLKHHNSIVRNIRIGVIESIVHTWLGEFLTQLKILYPNIEFELTAEPTMHLQALFAKGALDIIIQTAPVLDSTVVSSALNPLEICWVCHKDSHLAHRDATFDDIAESEIITFTRDSQPHLALCSMFENKGLKPKQIHCVTSISIISHLVQGGLGIATLPMAAIKNELDNGDLVVLQGVESPPLLSLHASWENLTDGKMKCAIVELAKSVSYGYTENIA